MSEFIPFIDDSGYITAPISRDNCECPIHICLWRGLEMNCKSDPVIFKAKFENGEIHDVFIILDDIDDDVYIYDPNCDTDFNNYSRGLIVGWCKI